MRLQEAGKGEDQTKDESKLNDLSWGRVAIMP
jgi:hypothetical protein